MTQVKYDWIKREFKKKEDWTEDRKKFQKFYQSEKWQRLRLIFLSENPICKICEQKGITEPAEHVDHIIPLIENYSLRLDFDNLQSLCISCHSKKTCKEQVLKKERERESNMNDLESFE